jgi:aminoglycoside/choline kinase family phosphotransferase
MLQKKELPETLLEFVACRPGARLHKIPSEASRRSFFRIVFGKKTFVAMVYPEPAPAEIERFRSVQEIYRAHGLRVPGIEEILGDRVVIQEDAGDLLLQRSWRACGGSERVRLLNECREILYRLATVPPVLATARLDGARQKWEMDFFIKHFFAHSPVRGCGRDDVCAALAALVGKLDPDCVFAHRDFHSRNLLVKGGAIVMVDFQDSLLAPRFYDLVSLAFDSYLDLGHAREDLWSGLEWRENDRRQMRLTALQRNIKALGTFAYQAFVCDHPAYARYIPRTLRHIRSHLQELADPELAVLAEYFSMLSK